MAGNGKEKIRIRREKPSNEWLTTFNDLMTLLLTFFVLLLSMSSLEGGKIRSLISELNAAAGVMGSSKHSEFPVFIPIMRVFLYGEKLKEVQHLHRDDDPVIERESHQITKPVPNEHRERIESPVAVETEEQGGKDGVSGLRRGKDRGDETAPRVGERPEARKAEGEHPLEEQAERLAADITGLSYSVDNRQNLVIRLPDRVLFELGKADIRPGAEPALKAVAGMLAQHPGYEVLVTGHTDTVPIHTPRFPSNWELSAARASNVVKYLARESGADPSRFMASGYGEALPAAPNDTPENRALNRRVEIKFIAKQ